MGALARRRNVKFLQMRLLLHATEEVKRHRQEEEGEEEAAATTTKEEDQRMQRRARVMTRPARGKEG